MTCPRCLTLATSWPAGPRSGAPRRRRSPGWPGMSRTGRPRWPGRRAAGARPTWPPRRRWSPPRADLWPRSPMPSSSTSRGPCPAARASAGAEESMTQPASTALPQHVGVINVGLPLFADAVASQGAPVISVDWRVPAGGQPAIVAALGKLYGQHSERIEAANAEVLRRLDSGVPMLTGVTTVSEAAPGLTGQVLLHCGPAVHYAQAPDPLRRSMQAAAVAEGWAASPAEADELLGSERLGLSPANAHRVVVPMATALAPGAPLYEVTNAAGGTTAFAPISQGPGEVAWFGCATDASIARLVFLREVAAPVIAEVLRRSGPVDVLAIAAQAVTMGDDVHVRTQAATNLLIKEWLPYLAGAGGGQVAAFARFLSGNHLFFLTMAMAAARSLTEWAAGVPDSSIVTTMSRNGTTFGIRLAGSPRWFTTEAPEVGHALYHPGR